MPVHLHVRLQYCWAQSKWNCADWGHIVFRDESRFQFCLDDNHRPVWRSLRQCGNSDLTSAHHIGSQRALWSGVPSSLIAGPLW
ncbi:hypothetical protein TNCV_1370801 [Trichonephila clavipes]|nr:hypothetical protein TNCV_1370801 [Trichonephila clavipes]